MKRIAWITDIHLDFVGDENLLSFLEQLHESQADALLFSGDIGEASSVTGYLSQVAAAANCPTYFVLGNHDFYEGSIREVRQQVSDFCDDHGSLHYLSQGDVFPLTDKVGLVGHDGWADGRIGDYESSEVMMNDYQLIKELAPYSKLDRWPILKQLGDEAAAHIERVLELGLEQFSLLMTLSLALNILTDVNCLEKLTQLEVLGLGSNQLTNVKGLEKLTQLRTLSLAGNQLHDVKRLEKLTQ